MRAFGHFGITFLLMTVVVGCGVETPNTARLEATLKKLSINMPATDLDTNLRAGDKRFIGINGIVCGPPGVPEADAIAVVRKFGIRCLEGTSDAVQGAKRTQLIDHATKYAEAYNVELLRRIHAGSVN